MPSLTNDQERYFAPLRIPFFDDAIMAKLRAFVGGVITDKSYFEHRYTHFDHIRLAEPLPAVEELRDLVDSCSVSAIAVCLLLPPNVTVPVHRDTENTSYRQSTITVPLLPENAYPGTNWYSDADGMDIVATANYGDMKPLLLNINEYHGNIITGDDWRCCLQIPLPISYAEAYDRISKNELFMGHDCVFE